MLLLQKKKKGYHGRGNRQMANRKWLRLDKRVHETRVVHVIHVIHAMVALHVMRTQLHMNDTVSDTTISLVDM